MVAPQAASLLRELAHELRDALSPVRSALDLMRLRGFGPEAGHALGPRIDQGLDRALATLDAFVLAEQCESGALELTAAPVSLVRLLELALEALPAPLRARCRPERPAADVEVLADASRSVQALAAMLLRALAVARDSPVEVRATPVAGGAQVRVAFRCAAPPVSEDWFGTYRSPPGAGPLALRTARALMRLQHGSLELTVPAPGRAELVAGFPPVPAAVPSAGAAGGAAAVGSAQAAGGDQTSVAAPGAGAGNDAAGIRLMMVEDNSEVRRAYREALTLLGYEVREARSAEEALAAVAESAPEIVLIDINLPGMNGYRLA
ncbi:MAG: response regulator, partial [Gammaproteobacteria bacterium]|nr:response regulator [Gammaproteobacteria bacterium]